MVNIGRKAEDLTGMRFGDLTAIKIDDTAPSKSGKHKKWICKCICGNTVSVTSGKLKMGVKQSCGKHSIANDNRGATAKEKAEYMRQLQSLPLEAKVNRTKNLIREWYDHYNGNVCVSFSGGKDSTVLLDIARQVFPDIKAVFINTGVEYPETVAFVKTFDNVDIIRPRKSFPRVVVDYGYPMISKEVSYAIRTARQYFRIIEEEYIRNGKEPPVKVAAGDYKKTLRFLESYC